ncbi:TVP38/TMEM64 family protein [Clostridiaceae bacterium M8S5]|nr:TVP38/TMEM64 family protein [Clostridiaceae bacterium M8S5]
MKSDKYKTTIIALFIIMIIFFMVEYFHLIDILSFENFKSNRENFRSLANKHYITAVLMYMSIFILISFGIPISALVILFGGFLFGWYNGFIYSVIGITIGSVPAYLFSKYIIGNWIDEKFGHRIKPIQDEINKNKISYLISVRFIPSFPLFVVNFVAGISNISLFTLVTTTFIGMLPYCLVYSYAGSNIGNINSPKEVMSPRMLAIFVVLTIIAFLPVIASKVKKTHPNSNKINEDT